MQKHQFTLAAGAALSISAEATYVRIIDIVATPTLSSSSTVRVTNDLGHDFEMRGKASVRIERSAKRWLLSNTTASSLAITLLIGAGEYTDNQITATLSTADPLAEVQADQCFFGGLSSATTASFFGALHFYNAGTKTAWLDRLEIAASEPAIWRLGRTTGPPGGVLSASGVNKNISGAAPTLQLLALNNSITVYVPTALLGVIPWMPESVSTNTRPFAFISRHPLRIQAGATLSVYNATAFLQTQAPGILAELEWREI